MKKFLINVLLYGSFITAALIKTFSSDVRLVGLADFVNVVGIIIGVLCILVALVYISILDSFVGKKPLEKKQYEEVIKGFWLKERIKNKGVVKKGPRVFYTILSIINILASVYAGYYILGFVFVVFLLINPDSKKLDKAYKMYLNIELMKAEEELKEAEAE